MFCKSVIRHLIRSRDLRADESGATAIEFAIVAVPFLTLVFGILELAFIFIINVSLSNAAANFATQLRTGQTQAGGVSQTSSSGTLLDLADAKKALCQNSLFPAATCIANLQIDVRPIASFGQTSSINPVTGTTFNTSNLCYYSGNAGDLVEMRAYYLYSVINPLFYPLGGITSFTNGGTTSGRWVLIKNTQVFKSETYPGETNTGAGC